MTYMRQVNALRSRIDLLVALDALLSTKSVTRAAQQASLSQPAMSRSLARLRVIFEDRLLVRTSGVTMLTPRAEALQEPLRDVLDRASRLLTPPDFYPPEAEHTFRAVIPDVIAGVILPRMLERLKSAAPGCKLELVPWLPGEARAIDFVVTSEVSCFPALRMTPLYRDHDVLAHRRGKEADKPLAQPHVAVIASGMVQDPVDAWLAELGLTRHIACVVPHYLLALQLIAQSDYVAILPNRLVAGPGAALGIGSTELPMRQSLDQIWLLHPANQDADLASQWIRKLVSEVANSVEVG